ncbi:hypothetical protein MUP01_12175 [Candidatus Bathyarchaeota archaeon]|nr:hypothetical protein [Candidatus Bathyarchaeota archaeon]
MSLKPSESGSQKTLGWKVHTPGLLKEIVEANPTIAGPMRMSILIFRDLLHQVAVRASQLNDPKLNALMIRLTLYAIANPDEADYDPVKVAEILETS